MMQDKTGIKRTYKTRIGRELGTTTHRITYPIKNSGDEKWKT